MWIKVCGITRAADALLAVELGVDALGLNFAPASPRCLDLQSAKKIADEARHAVEVGNQPGAAELVGVFVDAPRDFIHEVVSLVGLDRVQLHGAETPEALLGQDVAAYKALRIATQEDADLAERYGGDRILLDSKVSGAQGGTGHAFDWTLAAPISRRRAVILAGGLNAANVAQAIRQVRPYGVDTASGVESRPGIKDAQAMRDFVQAARGLRV